MCGKSELNPQIFGKACIALREQEFRVQQHLSAESDVTNFFTAVAFAGKAMELTPYAPIGKGVQLVATGAGLLNIYAAKKIREKESRLSDSLIDNTVHSLSRAVRYEEATLSESEFDYYEPKNAGETQAKKPIYSILRDPFAKSQELQHLSRYQVDPQNDLLPISSRRLYLKLLAADTKGERVTPKMLAEVFSEIQRQAVTASSSPDWIRESRNYQANVYLGTVFIDRVLGKKEFASSFSKIGKAAIALRKSVKMQAGAMTVLGAQVELGLAITDAVSSIFAPTDSPFKAISDQIAELHKDMLIGFQFLEVQNIKILRELHYIHFDLATKLETNSAKLDEVIDSTNQLQAKFLTFNSEFLRRKYGEAMVKAEAGIPEITTDPVLAKSNLNDCFKELSVILEYDAYSETYSGNSSTKKKIVKDIELRRNPYALIASYQKCLSLLGDDEGKRKLPNPLEWARAASSFAVLKLSSADLKTVLDNKLKDLGDDAKEISETIKETVKRSGVE